jgi:signal transduction histidine kinase
MNVAEQERIFELVYNRRHMIADAWFKAIAYTSFVPRTTAEVRHDLLGLTDQAIRLLFSAQFESDAARTIGAALPDMNYTAPESLSRTIEVLACQLIKDVPLEVGAALQPRLAALFGEIAAGFLKQARDIILTDQEEIRRALLMERRRAEAALAEARDQALETARLKSDFLATMSHELRTPLNVIIGFTDLTLEQYAGPLNEQQQSNLKRVSHNARILLEMINNVLDMTKIDAGYMQLVDEPLYTASVVQTAITNIETLVQSKQLQISVRQPDVPLPQLRGDANRFQQVFLNLLSNAVKFTPAHGTITVILEYGQAAALEVAAQPIDNQLSGLWVAVSVQDTGIGIPAEEHERIWSEFYQIDSSATREYSGTGLGLAIVKRLMVLMGGYVGMRSTVGGGSTFTLWLPVEHEQVTAIDRSVG